MTILVVFQIFSSVILFLPIVAQCGNKKSTPAQTASSPNQAKSVSSPVSRSPVSQGSLQKSPDIRARTSKRMEKEAVEDSFEKVQPRVLDVKRKQEVGTRKAENKGDYKTWNKVIENSEFNKTLSEKETTKEEKKSELKKAKDPLTLDEEEKKAKEGKPKDMFDLFPNCA